MTAAKFKRSASKVTVLPCGSSSASAGGPNNNMGLASDPTVEGKVSLCLDYCSLVFQETALERFKSSIEESVEFLYPGVRFTVSELKQKTWQFYPLSAYIHGPDGALVGRVGAGAKHGGVCVSLSGAGCALVDDWHCTMVQCSRLMARITRVDIAFDDFEAQYFRDIREVNEWALEGAFDPPAGGNKAATRFMDDHNKGKGSTVYVGSRGKKQLCIYEKGKQLGDPLSPWKRCELRLWSTDVVIPLDVLARPGAYLLGGYKLLADTLPMLEAETAKPERVRRAVKASAGAAVQFLRQQCGPTLDLLVRALGPDVWDLLSERVFRSTVPRRFRGMTRSLPELRSIVREQLGGCCASSLTA